MIFSIILTMVMGVILVVFAVIEFILWSIVLLPFTVLKALLRLPLGGGGGGKVLRCWLRPRCYTLGININNNKKERKG